MPRFLRYFWPALFWIAGIFVLTLMPGNYIPKVGSFWNLFSPDKLVHLFLFGVLGWLVIKGLNGTNPGMVFGHSYMVAIGLALFLGFATEMLQYILPIGRSGNIYDFIADIAGSALGGWFFIIYQRNFKKM